MFSITNDHEQRLVSGCVVEDVLAFNELSWEPNTNIEYLTSPPDNTASGISTPLISLLFRGRESAVRPHQEGPRSALGPVLRAGCERVIYLVGGKHTRLENTIRGNFSLFLTKVAVGAFLDHFYILFL